MARKSYDQVLKDVKDFYSDTSRSRSATSNDLSALKDEIDILISTLEDDEETDGFTGD